MPTSSLACHSEAGGYLSTVTHLVRYSTLASVTLTLCPATHHRGARASGALITRTVSSHPRWGRMRVGRVAVCWT